MRIGIDVRPLENNKAGIGTYVESLILGLSKVESSNEYYLYSNNSIPLGLPINFHKRVINIPNLLWHIFVYVDFFLNRLDVYHSTHSLIIPVMPKIRAVLTIHDLTGILFPNYHSVKVKVLYKLFLKLAVYKAYKIIVPSESTKRDILSLFRIQEEKVVIINEAPREFFKLRPTEEEKREVLKLYNISRPFLLFVSTLEPRKNIERLIRAFEIISKSYPFLFLVIVGKKGWLYDKIFKVVEDKKMEGKVYFLGYVSDKHLSFLYNLCEIFVFPSLYEGFGLTPLEAMAAGSLVVASSTSSIPECLDEAAVFCDPYSVSDIADKTMLLLSSKEVADKLREKSKDWILNFSWEKAARETVGVYKSIR